MATKRQRESRDKRRSAAVSWAEDATSSGPSYLKLPKGIEFYQITKGEHRFDLIPYVTKNNPKADEGFPHFVRQFEIYKIPRGDDKFDRFVVPSELGLKDPIAAAKRDGRLGKEESDVLRAQRRVLFLVNDKPGDPKNPLKVLDAVFFNRKLGFGEQLAVAINAMRSRYGEGFDPSSLDEGMTVQILTADEKYRSVSRIDFLPRKYKYPESVLTEATCLDVMLGVPDPDEMERLSFGGPRIDEVEDEDEEDEEPIPPASSNGKAAKKKPVKDDEPEDDDDEEEEESPPPKKGKKPAKDDDWDDEDEQPSPKKKKPPVKEEEEEEEDEEDPWDEEDDDEDPTPARSAGGVKSPATAGAKKRSSDEEEDEEEEDELDEDEEPAPKKKRAK